MSSGGTGGLKREHHLKLPVLPQKQRDHSGDGHWQSCILLRTKGNFVENTQELPFFFLIEPGFHDKFLTKTGKESRQNQTLQL